MHTPKKASRIQHLVPSWPVLGVLVVLTAVNWMLTHSGQGPGPNQIPVRVSALQSGDTVSLSLRRLVTGEATAELQGTHEDCRLLVAFNPDCPHCRKAAARMQTLPEGMLRKLTWVAENETSALRLRDEGFPSEIQVVWGEDVWPHLHVQAVPAGLWVSSDGVVQKSWPFQGKDEDLRPPTGCVVS